MPSGLCTVAELHSVTWRLIQCSGQACRCASVLATCGISSRGTMQHLRLPNLLRQIRGGVDKEPVLAVGTNGKARLGARPHACVARPCQTACRAATIPLRKASSRRRAAHEGGESPHSGPTQTRRDQNSAGRYPLISRPMQISTSLGVVHDMAFFLLGCGDNIPFLKCPSAVSCKMALCLRRFGKIARGQLSVSP